MKLFSWKAVVGNESIADGYLLAENREEAEKNWLLYHTTTNMREWKSTQMTVGGMEK